MEAYLNRPNEYFEDADLAISVESSISIVGASGAGKTTAVNILLGLLKL